MKMILDQDEVAEIVKAHIRSRWGLSEDEVHPAVHFRMNLESGKYKLVTTVHVQPLDYRSPPVGKST